MLYNKLFVTKLGSSESVINILRIFIRPIQSYFKYLIEMDVHNYCETIIPLRIYHFTSLFSAVISTSPPTKSISPNVSLFCVYNFVDLVLKISQPFNVRITEKLPKNESKVHGLYHRETFHLPVYISIRNSGFWNDSSFLSHP